MNAELRASVLTGATLQQLPELEEYDPLRPRIWAHAFWGGAGVDFVVGFKVGFTGDTSNEYRIVTALHQQSSL